MARSTRHMPIAGITTAESEKDEKRKANRRYRRAVRMALSVDADSIPHRREVMDPWMMSKDDKKWHGEYAKDLFKNN